MTITVAVSIYITIALLFAVYDRALILQTIHTTRGAFEEQGQKPTSTFLVAITLVMYIWLWPLRVGIAIARWFRPKVDDGVD